MASLTNGWHKHPIGAVGATAVEPERFCSLVKKKHPIGAVGATAEEPESTVSLAFH